MPIRVFRCPEGHDFEEILSGDPPSAVVCPAHRKRATRVVTAPAAPARGLRRQNEVTSRDLRGRRVREVASGKHRGLAVE